MDHTRVAYSYKHQCLVNIIVDGVPGAPSDQSQWHLPTYDPHNQNKYHYRLHSLDLYFWTQSDALQFVNGIRRVLPASQVEVVDEPPPPPVAHQQQQHPYATAAAVTTGQSHHSHHDINPLVQKLEHVAVSDPAYSSPQPTQQNIPTFAPPPAAAASNGGDSPQHPQQQQQPAASFAPIPYNPAAPAAPEQIQHREKTPPPVEEDGYDPLAAAVARDHGAALPGPPPPPTQAGTAPFSPGFPPAGPGTASAPPPNNGIGIGLASPGYPPSTQFGHLQRSSTMPVSGLVSPGLASPGLGSPGLVSPGLPTTPGLVSPYGANFPGSPGFAPPPHHHHHHHPMSHPHPQQVQTPGLPPGGYQHPHQPTPPAVQSPGLPPPPPGGYAPQFNYGANQLPPGGGGIGDYTVHQQVYRPTEAEVAASKYGAESKYTRPASGEGGKPSKLGQNAERLEKGVTGMLKRFEKKFG